MLNEQLLEDIDSINGTIVESELNVLLALGDQYAKMGMITEYASPAVLCEFDIIQESSKDKKKRGFFGTIGHGIKSALKFIWKCIITFFKWVGDFFISIGKSIKKFFDDSAEEKAKEKKKKEEKQLIDSILQNMQENLYQHNAQRPERDVVNDLVRAAKDFEQGARNLAEHHEKEEKKKNQQHASNTNAQQSSSSSSQHTNSAQQSGSQSNTQQSSSQQINTAISNFNTAVSQLREDASKKTVENFKDAYNELRKICNRLSERTLETDTPFAANTAKMDQFKNQQYDNIEAVFGAIWKRKADANKVNALGKCITHLRLTGKTPLKLNKSGYNRVTIIMPKIKDEVFEKIMNVEDSIAKDDFKTIEANIREVKSIGIFYTADKQSEDMDSRAKEMRLKCAELQKKNDYLDKIEHNKKIVDKEAEQINKLITDNITVPLTSSIDQMSAYIKAVRECIDEYKKTKNNP